MTDMNGGFRRQNWKTDCCRSSKNKENRNEVNFLPDDTIFEKTRFRAEEIKSRMHETAYLNPSLTIVFEDKRGAEPEAVTYHEPDGILGFIKDLNKNKETLHEPIYFKGEAEGDRG